MTAAIEAPASGIGAVPMRVVDTWRAEPTGTGLAITARLRVDGDDPNLRGHFPGFPVLPGVFMVETLCQTMAQVTGPSTRLRRLHSVRFLAPLLAGDELTLDIDAVAVPDSGEREERSEAEPRSRERKAGSVWRVTAQGSRSDGTRAVSLKADFGTEG